MVASVKAIFYYLNGLLQIISSQENIKNKCCCSKGDVSMVIQSFVFDGKSD